MTGPIGDNSQSIQRQAGLQPAAGLEGVQEVTGASTEQATPLEKREILNKAFNSVLDEIVKPGGLQPDSEIAESTLNSLLANSKYAGELQEMIKTLDTLKQTIPEDSGWVDKRATLSEEHNKVRLQYLKLTEKIMNEFLEAQGMEPRDLVAVGNPGKGSDIDAQTTIRGRDPTNLEIAEEQFIAPFASALSIIIAKRSSAQLFDMNFYPTHPGAIIANLRDEIPDTFVQQKISESSMRNRFRQAAMSMNEPDTYFNFQITPLENRGRIAEANKMKALIDQTKSLHSIDVGKRKLLEGVFEKTGKPSTKSSNAILEDNFNNAANVFHGKALYEIIKNKNLSNPKILKQEITALTQHSEECGAHLLGGYTPHGAVKSTCFSKFGQKERLERIGLETGQIKRLTEKASLGATELLENSAANTSLFMAKAQAHAGDSATEHIVNPIKYAGRACVGNIQLISRELNSNKAAPRLLSELNEFSARIDPIIKHRYGDISPELQKANVKKDIETAFRKDSEIIRNLETNEFDITRAGNSASRIIEQYASTLEKSITLVEREEIHNIFNKDNFNIRELLGPKADSENLNISQKHALFSALQNKLKTVIAEHHKEALKEALTETEQFTAKANLSSIEQFEAVPGRERIQSYLPKIANCCRPIFTATISKSKSLEGRVKTNLSKDTLATSAGTSRLSSEITQFNAQMSIRAKELQKTEAERAMSSLSLSQIADRLGYFDGEIEAMAIEEGLEPAFVGLSKEESNYVPTGLDPKSHQMITESELRIPILGQAAAAA